jgi:hypothetical protein
MLAQKGFQVVPAGQILCGTLLEYELTRLSN